MSIANTLYKETPKGGPLSPNALRYGLTPQVNLRTDLDAATTALVDLMTVKPGGTRLDIIDNTIRLLKGQNIGGLNPSLINVWDKLDALWMYAAHTQQASLINWKTPGTRDSILVNSPTFVADSHIASPTRTDVYIDTQFNISTSWAVGAANNCHFGHYVEKNPMFEANHQLFFGVDTDSPFFYLLAASQNGDIATLTRLHVKGIDTNMRSTATSDRYYIACARPTTQAVYINGNTTPVSSNNSNAMNVSSNNIRLLNLLAVSTWSTLGVRFFHIGSDITDADAAVFSAALNGYYLTQLAINGY